MSAGVILAALAIVAALALAAIAASADKPRRRRRRHAATLARIELLEIELGIRPAPLGQLVDLKQGNYRAAATELPKLERSDMEAQLEAHRRERERLRRYAEGQSKREREL